MSRRLYLVTYDISDDRRRNRVFSTLLAQGDHAQYSVFLCELDARELASVRARLRQEIHDREDQVLILDLGKSDQPLDRTIECLGRRFTPTSRVTVV